MNAFSRMEPLFGKQALNKLSSCRVAVFGAGGVGGYVIEALARSGVGAIDIVDGDEIAPSNINRQILATRKTVGRGKAETAKERIAEINPDCKVSAVKIFFLPETADEINFADYDYIVDAIDTVAGKLAIAERAVAAGVRVISCMGTGNKVNPAELKVSDIYSTSVCPLARVMRRELKKRNIPALKVVYSEEQPVTPRICAYECENEPVSGRRVPASAVFVPAAAGFIIAAEVVKDLIDFGGSKTIDKNIE